MTTFTELQNHKHVKWRSSERYPDLVVAKYSKEVFFKNLFDETLEEARGHVYDKVTGERVVNSFTKIYNFMERNTFIGRDVPVLAVEKINGFMAAATYVPKYDEVIISTTGSLDSDFVEYARQVIPQSALDFIRNSVAGNRSTFIFEIVHPDDPHIIPEKVGAYLLGARYIKSDTPYSTSENKELALDQCAVKMGVMRPPWRSDILFSDAVRLSKEAKHEGYVIYSEQQSLKIKSPYYLIQKLIARKKDILTLDKSKVDEEYFPLLDYVANYPQFNEIDEQGRLAIMRNFLENQ